MKQPKHDMNKRHRNSDSHVESGNSDDHVNRLAWFLDNSIPIPGLKYRIGVDGLLGLIPGIGDVTGALLSSYIIGYAVQNKMPVSVILQMCFNVILESIVGTIPIIGDIFDFAWKANLKNTRLMQKYNQQPRETSVSSRVLVFLVAIAVFSIIVAIFILGIWLLRMLFQSL